MENSNYQRARFTRTKTLAASAAVIAASLTSGNVFATVLPSGTITETSSAGGVNTYSLTVTDAPAATASIGTVWFAWVPGEDFLATSPTSITEPSFWNPVVTHGGSGDGFAIQWVSEDLIYNIPAGSSMTFGFSSTDTPQQLAGDSVFYNTTPVTTTFAYSGGPEQGDADQFTFTVVPEPTTCAALLLPIALLLRRRTPRSE